MTLQFRLKHGVEQRHEGEDLLLLDQRGRALRLTAPALPLVTMLQRLGDGGGTLLALMQGASSLASFIALQQLERRGCFKCGAKKLRKPDSCLYVRDAAAGAS